MLLDYKLSMVVTFSGRKVARGSDLHFTNTNTNTNTKSNDDASDCDANVIVMQSWSTPSNLVSGLPFGQLGQLGQRLSS